MQLDSSWGTEMGVKTIQIEVDTMHTGRKTKDRFHMHAHFQLLVSGTMVKSKYEQDVFISHLRFVNL